jgi:hypothetical protein
VGEYGFRFHRRQVAEVCGLFRCFMEPRMALVSVVCVVIVHLVQEMVSVILLLPAVIRDDINIGRILTAVVMEMGLCNISRNTPRAGMSTTRRMRVMVVMVVNKTRVGMYTTRRMRVVMVLSHLLWFLLQRRRGRPPASGIFDFGEHRH